MKSTPRIRLVLCCILTCLASLLLAVMWTAGCASHPIFETRLPEDQPSLLAVIPTASAAPTSSIVPTTQTTIPPLTPTVENTTTALAAQESPSPASTQVCQDGAGQVTDQAMPSDLLNGPLEFKVYLPPCYADALSRRYAVLFLLHGQTYTNDQWIRLGATSTTDQLIDAGAVSPFLIVMPYEKEWLQPEQTLFGDALVSELVPWIDQHYRTLPGRSNRAIGGLSRGAAWAVHLGLSQWELFGAIGAHSLPVFWNDSDQISHWLDAIPEGDVPRIYLDIGRSDADLSSAVSLENLLNSRNIPHEWHLQPGFHTEDYWRAHVEEYLRWYAANW